MVTLHCSEERPLPFSPVDSSVPTSRRTACSLRVQLSVWSERVASSTLPQLCLRDAQSAGGGEPRKGGLAAFHHLRFPGWLENPCYPLPPTKKKRRKKRKGALPSPEQLQLLHFCRGEGVDQQFFRWENCSSGRLEQDAIYSQGYCHVNPNERPAVIVKDTTPPAGAASPREVHGNRYFQTRHSKMVLS